MLVLIGSMRMTHGHCSFPFALPELLSVSTSSGAARFVPPRPKKGRDGWQRQPFQKRNAAPEEGGQGIVEAEGKATNEQEDLAQKLAAAEAEAEQLRRELERRRQAEANGSSLSNASSSSSSKPKIDGIGYRDTIFSGPKTAGKLAQKDGGVRAWGLTEADIINAEGGAGGLKSEFGVDADDNPINEEQASRIIQRRLLVGLALSGGALGLSFISIPTTLTRPTKPLFVYLVPLVRLQSALTTVQDQAEYLDALGLRAQLKLATGSLSSAKDNLLSTAALLDSSVQATASKLAFEILDYLAQADYSKYFEGIGMPGPYQQAEYIKFSTQSLEVARTKLSQFLALVPEEAVSAARSQLEAGGVLQ